MLYPKLIVARSRSRVPSGETIEKLSRFYNRRAIAALTSLGTGLALPRMSTIFTTGPAWPSMGEMGSIGARKFVMDDRQTPAPSQVNIETEVAEIAHRLGILARSVRGNPEALLVILRAIELAHRETREELFLEALPNNRHALYDLLKELEATGGWPYIPRMQLRALLANLPESQP